MSRREFRANVDDARPSAAWAMAVLAGSTLWITQQLAVWAMVVQLLAIAISYWRRRMPFAWQRSPIALNLDSDMQIRPIPCKIPE